MRDHRDVATRLRRVERTNRMLLLAVCALVAVSCATLNDVEASADGPLTATAFRLVDAAGEIVARLGTDERGPHLILRDAQGRERLALRHEDSQTGVFVIDAAGDTRIGVAQFAHGGGGVALHGKGTKGAAVLYLKKSGSLSFYADDGTVLQRYPALQ